MAKVTSSPSTTLNTVKKWVSFLLTWGPVRKARSEETSAGEYTGKPASSDPAAFSARARGPGHVWNVTGGLISKRYGLSDSPSGPPPCGRSDIHLPPRGRGFSGE